jgi:hypothetical protein
MAVAEKLKVPERRFEFQMLYGMAEPVKSAPVDGQRDDGLALHDITNGRVFRVNHGRARLHLAKFCKRRRLPRSDSRPLLSGVSATWREIAGDPWMTTTQEARFHDLVVLARRDNIDDLGSLILNAGRPVLLAPQQTPENLAPTIAIAWKETAEAARAITAAMPLLAKADRILVVSVEDGHGSAATMESAERMARQLRWHGRHCRDAAAES